MDYVTLVRVALARLVSPNTGLPKKQDIGEMQQSLNSCNDDVLNIFRLTRARSYLQVLRGGHMPQNEACHSTPPFRRRRLRLKAP